MVSFICNQCQDTLKKGKVEKHLAGCKATLLSCVDCGNEFDTAQYVLHSTCVSEEEKHMKGMHAPSKKQSAQQKWNTIVRKACEEHIKNPELAPALRKILTVDNIPQKRKKFMNFVRSSFHLSPIIGDKVWQLIAKFQKQHPEVVKAAEVKKRKRSDSGADVAELDTAQLAKKARIEQKRAHKLARKAAEAAKTAEELAAAAGLSTNGKATAAGAAKKDEGDEGDEASPASAAAKDDSDDSSDDSSDATEGKPAAAAAEPEELVGESVVKQSTWMANAIRKQLRQTPGHKIMLDELLNSTMLKAPSAKDRRPKAELEAAFLATLTRMSKVVVSKGMVEIPKTKKK